MEKINILIIEDDEDYAFLEKETLLDELDCEIRIVNSRLELRSRDIQFADIILLDFNLPDATGAEILEDIRRETDVPVIIVTGNQILQAAVDTFKEGASDFLVKSPANLAMLSHIVKHNLHKFEDEQNLKREIKEKEALYTKIETLNQVLTTLAHYINNSTTTIYGYAQLCDRDSAELERCKKLSDVCIRETNKITFVLEELENLINTSSIKTTEYVNIPDAMFAIEENINAKMDQLDKNSS